MFRLVLCLVITVYLSFGYQGVPELYERDDANSAPIEVFDRDTPVKDRTKDVDLVPDQDDEEFVDHFENPMENAPTPLNDPFLSSGRLPGTDSNVLNNDLPARRRRLPGKDSNVLNNDLPARRRRLPGKDSNVLKNDLPARRRRLPGKDSNVLKNDPAIRRRLSVKYSNVLNNDPVPLRRRRRRRRRRGK